MRLITAAELDHQPEAVLHSKFMCVSRFLHRTDATTTARRNALASLENINRAIIKRRLKGPGCNPALRGIRPCAPCQPVEGMPTGRPPPTPFSPSPSQPVLECCNPCFGIQGRDDVGQDTPTSQPPGTKRNRPDQSASP
ncbi:hypothetical protein [Frigidibacter mobilis]|uniref:hypothetical protein n=1 Tax=Frigidibacter mobilis TaxID=1335048 RepID=UPI001A92ACD7|nr:hypothetical protein [Frigidibacter mobilis]